MFIAKNVGVGGWWWEVLKRNCKPPIILTPSNDNLHFDVYSSSSPHAFICILVHTNICISTKLFYNLLFNLIISHVIIPFCNMVFK